MSHDENIQSAMVALFNLANDAVNGMEADELGETVQEIAELMEEGMGTTVDKAVTFEDAGVMTCQQGIVLRNADGSEFQITIVRSR